MTIRPRTRTGLGTVCLAAALTLLAACSSGSSSKGSSTTAPRSTTTTTTSTTTVVPASAAPPTLCDLVQPRDLDSLLGSESAAPAHSVIGASTLCRYPGTNSLGVVVIRYRTGMNLARFEAARQSFAQGNVVRALPGVGDAGYVSVLESGTGVNRTVVALDGTTEVLVSTLADAPHTQQLMTLIRRRLAAR